MKSLDKISIQFNVTVLSKILNLITSERRITDGTIGYFAR
jgi:hypothetical protein